MLNFPSGVGRASESIYSGSARVQNVVLLSLNGSDAVSSMAGMGRCGFEKQYFHSYFPHSTEKFNQVSRSLNSGATSTAN